MVGRSARRGKIDMPTPLNGSILKAFEILNLFSPQRTKINMATIAEELDIVPATAHRFLASLEAAGAIVSYQRGAYMLAPQMVEWGELAEASNALAPQIQPVLDELAAELAESVMACRLGRQGATCLAVARAKRVISVNIDVGSVLPLRISAQGKIFLAHMNAQERQARLAGEAPPTDLKEIKAQGFAQNRGENEPDIGAVAVPVFGSEGRLVCTLSVFGLLSRFDDDFVQTAKESLKAARHRLEGQLG